MDYYKILELDKNATEDQIKKAYRKLARKYHPDVNAGDKESERKFKEINEANEVLSNAENRAKYDSYGKDWKHADQIKNAQDQQRQQRAQSQQFGGNYDAGGEEMGGDFSEYFESMFGNRGRRQNIKYKGADQSAEMHLNLKDVYKSHQQILNINNKKVRLTIPAGVENGQEIRVAKQGGEGANGGPNGDLLIKFIITNNTPFKRDGKNLYLNVDLDLYIAMLGGEVTVPTMDGEVTLKVNAETQNGTKVKLKGKGFPIYKDENTKGDLYITYQIKIPTGLTDKEKSLIVELQKLRKND